MLLANKTPPDVLFRYSDYADVFLSILAMGLQEHISINDYAIELEENKKLFYSPIYSLGLIKLKILKTYIKTYPKTEFIGSSKSLADIPIFFDQKQDGIFHFNVN